MRYLLAIIAAAFLSVSCVSTGAFQAHLDDVADLRAGAISESAFASRTKELKDDMKAIQDKQEEGAVGLIEMATGGTGLVGLAWGLYKKTKADINRDRDQKYVAAAPDTAPEVA
jgi:hypothetical protein